ncbi:MAG: oligoribonuclease [Deltaproteobacteria bacterium]|nr:oligoribonuclease [Deltaproteobacteria bacterium]
MRENLVWMDLEMTGLEPENAVILEIATIVTDGHLRILAEGPNIAIRHPDAILSKMDDWNREHHSASGLLARAAASTYDCAGAEEATLAFLRRYCREGASPLCGNSIWQDRRFLIRHMPKLEAFFHYRIIDVSSIKEIVKRWYPSLPEFEKKKTHTALSDIRESIGELAYYRGKVFVSLQTRSS